MAKNSGADWRMAEAVRRSCLVVFVAIVLCSCAKGDGGQSGDEGKVQYVEMAGKEYEIGSARYFDGFYEFIGEECVCLHIELLLGGRNTGAGMTVEISKGLMGRKMSVAPSDTFWFFHAGTGRENFSLESTYKAERFGGVVGWFVVEYGENTDEIVFEWEISNPTGDRISTRGYIASEFERISSI